MLGSLLGLVGLGAAAAGGVGKNDTRAKNYAESGLYDPNRFNYGGTPGGADADANRYRNWADSAQTRGAEQVNYSNADGQRQNALEAREGQRAMAGLMTQRAMGQAPSIAQMQADRQMQQLGLMTGRQMQQAQAAQSAQAASSRGAAGVALGAQNAANNIANAHGMMGSQAAMSAADISGQAQVNAASERMAAEQAAFGAYGGMRGMDFQGQSQDAQQAQYQAQLNAAQRAQNDQFTQGMTQNEMAVRQQQLAAGMHQQDIMSGSHQNSTNTNVGISQNNANWEMGMLKGALGGGQGAADAATATSLPGAGQSASNGAPGLGAQTKPLPGRAFGGPVAGGNPYVVGEFGPEVIVPHSNGFVIPNGLLSGTSAGSGPSSGAGPATFDKLNPDASMDVLGSIRAHGAAGTKYTNDPTGGMQRGGLF